LPVLNPAAYQRRIHTSQRVVIESRQGKFDFISQLEVDSERLVLVATSILGNKLFQVVYTRAEKDLQTWGVPLDFDIDYLLTDLSLIFGPASKLADCLSGSNSGISLLDNYIDHTRRVSGPDLTALVKYSQTDPWSGSIVYRNTTLDYTIAITMLETTPL